LTEWLWRCACQVGILGLLAQEAVTGKDPIGQLFDGTFF
jgi:hypothetical protein